MASVSRDYSWQPSQGIRFVPSSRGKVWQPSQDIIFSSSLATTVASHTIQSPRSRSPPLSSSSNPRPSIQSRTLDPNALRKKRLPPPANRPLGSYRESGVDYDLTSNIPEKLSTSRRKPYSVINPEGKGSRLSATRQKRVEEQRMRFQRLPEQSAANEWAAQGEAARQEAKQKEANQRELQKQEAAKQKKAEQLALMAAQGLGATERRLTEECQKLSFGDVNEGKSKRLLLKPNRRDLDSRHQSRLIRSQWNTLATEFKLSDIADDIVRSFRGGLLPLINRFCYNTAASISALNQTEKATTAGLPRSAQSQIPPDYFPVTKLNTMPDAPSASWNYPISANNPSSRLVSQICSLGAKNNLVLESSRLEPPRLEHQFLRKCESTPLGKSFTKPQSKRSTTTSQHTKELQRLSRAESLDSSSVAAEMCCSPMEIPTLLIPGAESLEESSPLARGPPGNIATSMPTSGPPEFLSLSPTRSLKGSVMASSVPLEDDVNAGESEKSLSKHDEDLRTSQRDQGDQRTHHTPLQFKIPKDILREKMLASKSTTAAHWQHTLYRDPSGEKVRVHFCVSYESTERIAQLFLDKDVIGFDIEWRPQATAADGIKKNVSLIQLASEERIALFHIARYATGDTADELVTPSLRKILASPKITKVGVSIKSDCTRLRKFLAIEARGLFELSHLYKLIKYSNHNVKKVNKKLVSLAQQVEEHLQLPLGKGPVRLSPWDEPLSYEQISCLFSEIRFGGKLLIIFLRRCIGLVRWITAL